ncbi:MAG: hypothetical protein HY908_15130 [Myxococcales bacterium]|nr:hypothetical protein [Myxococcales bacterium]
MLETILVVTLVLALAAGIGWLVGSLFLGYPLPALEKSALSRREQALVAAAADAFFPPDGPIPLSGRQAGLLAYFDGYVKHAPAGQRFLMRLLLAFTEFSPLVFGPRHTRFTRLAPADQLRLLDSASKSRFYFRRVTFLSLRTLMTMGYLSNPEVARHMHMTADTDPFGLRRAASASAPGHAA